MKAQDSMADSWLWLNGQFARERDAGISPLDRGFQYGDGVFETLRVERGHPLYLESHLKRMSQSLLWLRISEENFPDWGGVLRHLVHLNGMADKTAAAKILVTRGSDPRMGIPPSSCPTLSCFLRPFSIPEESTHHQGLRLHVHQEGFTPFLARHKTLNYLFFQVARQAALDHGQDESILLDCEGRVTETSTGALLMRMNGQWQTPASPHRLPSTTLQAVTALLAQRGERVLEAPILPTQLQKAEAIWILNSLMGIMPAREVDGRPVPRTLSQVAHQLRALWLKQGLKGSGEGD